MFDVAWTDPTVETNAQRRQRKAEAGETTRRSSLKSASSSDASSIQKAQTTSRAGWGLFGGGGKKSSSQKSSSQKAPGSSKSKASLTLDTKGEEAVMSGGKEGFSKDDLGRAESNNGTDFSRQPEPTSPSTTTVSNFSGGLSSISGAQSRYNTTNSSWSGSVAGSKTYDFDEYSIDRSMSKLDLSPNDTISEDWSDRYSSVSSQHFQSQPVPRGLQQHTRPPSRNRLQDRHFDDSARYGPSRPSRIEEHQAPSVSSQTSQFGRESRARGNDEIEETTLQRSVRRMDAASPKIILERLREEWRDIADASIYKELEMDKKLWMLAGFQFLLSAKKVTDDIAALSRGPPFSSPSNPGVGRVLSLYENQASATYLSASYPSSEIHHPSATPCTAIHIPPSRLRGLVISTPVSPLPYPSSIFSIISCFPLGSVLPSPSLPIILKECHRVLEPQGTLKLTLMDPIPLTNTMGPITRNWFEDHLVLKLETKFRCLKPTRLVPIWLQDVGFAIAPPAKPKNAPDLESNSAAGHLGGSGGRTLNMIFPAVARGEGEYRSKGAVKREPISQNKRELELLISTVGRMIWKELWGDYVVGKEWWWENESVVEECARLRTRWDVVVIEAVKIP